MEYFTHLRDDIHGVEDLHLASIARAVLVHVQRNRVAAHGRRSRIDDVTTHDTSDLVVWCVKRCQVRSIGRIKLADLAADERVQCPHFVGDQPLRVIVDLRIAHQELDTHAALGRRAPRSPQHLYQRRGVLRQCHHNDGSRRIALGIVQIDARAAGLRRREDNLCVSRLELLDVGLRVTASKQLGVRNASALQVVAKLLQRSLRLRNRDLYLLAGDRVFRWDGRLILVDSPPKHDDLPALLKFVLDLLHGGADLERLLVHSPMCQEDFAVVAVRFLDGKLDLAQDVMRLPRQCYLHHLDVHSVERKLPLNHHVLAGHVVPDSGQSIERVGLLHARLDDPRPQRATLLVVFCHEPGCLGPALLAHAEKHAAAFEVRHVVDLVAGSRGGEHDVRGVVDRAVDLHGCLLLLEQILSRVRLVEDQDRVAIDHAPQPLLVTLPFAKHAVRELSSVVGGDVDSSRQKVLAVLLELLLGADELDGNAHRIGVLLVRPTKLVAALLKRLFERLVDGHNQHLLARVGEVLCHGKDLPRLADARPVREKEPAILQHRLDRLLGALLLVWS